jgi:hypothetical protein
MYLIHASWLFIANLAILDDCLICLMGGTGPACCPDAVVKYVAGTQSCFRTGFIILSVHKGDDLTTFIVPNVKKIRES